jgi:hypothetical protein
MRRVTNLLGSLRPDRGLRCYVGSQRNTWSLVGLRQSWDEVRTGLLVERETYVSYKIVPLDFSHTFLHT